MRLFLTLKVFNLLCSVTKTASRKKKTQQKPLCLHGLEISFFFFCAIYFLLFLFCFFPFVCKMATQLPGGVKVIDLWSWKTLLVWFLSRSTVGHAILSTQSPLQLTADTLTNIKNDCNFLCVCKKKMFKSGGSSAYRSFSNGVKTEETKKKVVTSANTHRPNGKVFASSSLAIETFQFKSQCVPSNSLCMYMRRSSAYLFFIFSTGR